MPCLGMSTCSGPGARMDRSPELYCIFQGRHVAKSRHTFTAHVLQERAVMWKEPVDEVVPALDHDAPHPRVSGSSYVRMTSGT